MFGPGGHISRDHDMADPEKRSLFRETCPMGAVAVSGMRRDTDFRRFKGWYFRWPEPPAIETVLPGVAVSQGPHQECLNRRELLAGDTAQGLQVSDGSFQL